MAFFYGTNRSDSIERYYVSSGVVRNPSGSSPGNGYDEIYGYSGNDYLNGAGGGDYIDGGIGDDYIYGDDYYGFGSDILLGGDGNDTIDGGGSYDDMYGGAGNDTYYVDNYSDYIYDSSGNDTVWATISYTLGTGVENLNIDRYGDSNISGTGNGLANTIVGSYGNNSINGLNGNDALRGGDGNDTIRGGAGADEILGGNGFDTLRGEGGNDILQGGFDPDLLIGGAGSDIFDFDSIAASSPIKRDTIRSGDGATAFQGAGAASGDRIDVSAIDANESTTLFNDAFVFGTATGRGRLWTVNSGTLTLVRANTDNDAAIEFELAIDDGSVLAAAYRATDFFL